MPNRKKIKACENYKAGVQFSYGNKKIFFFIHFEVDSLTVVYGTNRCYVHQVPFKIKEGFCKSNKSVKGIVRRAKSLGSNFLLRPCRDDDLLVVGDQL